MRSSMGEVVVSGAPPVLTPLLPGFTYPAADVVAGLSRLKVCLKRGR